MIYLCAAELSGVADVRGRRFLEEATEVFDLVGTVLLASDTALATCSPTAGDAIVLVNPVQDAPLPVALRGFLERAASMGAEIFPVALETQARFPPKQLEHKQSYDLHDFQARREHPADFVGPAAQDFARRVISETMPTCHRRKATWFITHARADGEALARAVDLVMAADHQDTFRDLLDIAPASTATNEIEQALERTDILIFLDSPEASTSQWIERELATAIGQRTPVVWVRIDPQVQRETPLGVLPGGQPDITITSQELATDPAGFVEEVMQRAFRANHAIVAQVLSAWADLRVRASEQDIVITPESLRQLIWRVSIPVQSHYPADPLLHTAQIFGRRPRVDDMSALSEFIEDSAGDEPLLRNCDARLLLGPQPQERIVVEEGEVIDSVENYRDELVGAPLDDGRSPWLFLSGSFPDDADTNDEVLRAVQDVAGTWFSLGGRIVIGGHPTITPAVVGEVRRWAPNREAQHLAIFQSRFFESEPDYLNFEGFADVRRVRSQGERERSLLQMRREMLEFAQIGVMVAVGGKAEREGIVPGIDVEADLARKSGIMTLYLAAPGGRASQVVEEIDGRPNGWAAHAQPPFSAEFVKRAAGSSEYRGITREIYGLLVDQSEDGAS